MLRKIVMCTLCIFLFNSVAYCADGFPLRGPAEMWMTPPAVGQHAKESNWKVILYRAGGRMTPSTRYRYNPEVSNRYYYDCSFYKYCDCSDVRNSRCWQCRHWIYDYQFVVD